MIYNKINHFLIKYIFIVSGINKNTYKLNYVINVSGINKNTYKK